ncbi:expressed unknown protein [Seminavis robusta]|uniref:Uncharacterized protein n=1 Tax=Seminavis robusta TaxID=568900 RepID=A0A9N8EVZ6_9STRA|nr:expressed unknown protein [Seminavis robusta]|eukprot:Sro1719_g293400.1 n/a (284) ;mRNA; f:8611-9576
MGCFACGKRDATYIEEFPPTTESPKRFCTGCADRDRCVPTRRCKFIDQEGVQCRGWYTSGGYCKKHGGTTRGDCPDCGKRGSFTKHAFSLDGLDPAVKLCGDDSRNIPGMASDEPFVVVDAPEVQSSWKRYLTVQCLCNQQMNEEVWKKLQNTFMAHYLPRYTECVVKNGELLFADQVKTEDQVEKRLQEIFDMNKKSFELRENRMLAVLYWCPNKEDATKPVLAGFWFLRAYPDDLEGFLLVLDSTVDERSLEAVLQRSSVFRFAETPTKEEKLAGRTRGHA